MDDAAGRRGRRRRRPSPRAAALFGGRSGDLADRVGAAAERCGAAPCRRCSALPAGCRVRDGGRVVAGLGVGGADPAVCARARRAQRRWRRERPGPSSASPSSAAARSAACTPRTWPASPASRCGPSTPGPSTSPRSSAHGLRVTGRADFVAAGPRPHGRRRPARRATSASSPPRPRTRARPSRPRGRARRRGRGQRAERARQRGGHRRAGAAGDPREHRHGRRGHGARRRALRRAGDSWLGPFEPQPAPMARDRAAGRAARRGRAADARAGRRPRAAVDEGRLQLRDQPARRADRAAGGPGLHGPARCAPRSTR